MFRLSLVLVIFLLASDGFAAFPSDIERCKLSDGQCLLKSANNVLKKYSGGYAEINLPSVDPMYIDHVHVVQETGIVTVRGDANNSFAAGLSNGKIYRFDTFDGDRTLIKFRTPRLNVNGNYKTVAHVISLPIDGKGKYRVAFNDFDVSLRSNLTKFTREGKEYFQLSNTKMSFEASGGELHLSDLPPIANAFLTASFDIIKSSLSVVVSEVWSVHFEKILNEVLNTNPIDELFLI